MNFRPENRGHSHLAHYEFDIRDLKTEIFVHLMEFSFFKKMLLAQ